jgi:tRNA-binding protein
MRINTIDFEDFSKVQICAGTIIQVEESKKLNKPSFILSIDFGKRIGLKKSSAQLTVNYNTSDLINRQILAVINFKPKQIGNIISEVLVLGLPDEKNEAILISPDLKIENGKRVY